jgi:hypothetical protein
VVRGFSFVGGGGFSYDLDMGQRNIAVHQNPMQWPEIPFLYKQDTLLRSEAHLKTTSFDDGPS